jgi:hypothetical protein
MIKCSLHSVPVYPELNGTNCLKFYYIDLIESVCRVIQHPTYANKLYYAFKMQTDSYGDQVFQAANSEAHSVNHDLARAHRVQGRGC